MILLFLSVIGALFTCLWLLGFYLFLYFNRQWGVRTAFLMFNEDAKANHFLTNRWWGYTIAWLLGPILVVFQVYSEPDGSVVEGDIDGEGE